MLAPPPQRKRHRSPSPPGDGQITSPLDIILKRRRQNAQNYIDISPSHHHSNPYFPSYPQPNFHQTSPAEVEAEPEAESSNAPWERFVEKRRTRQWEKLNAPQSQPSPVISLDSSPHQHHGYSYPSAGPSRHQMSSSPVRHHPPSSSPFRPSQERAEMEYEEMDEEERKREWGEEYATQNSLLHQLHMARMSTQRTPGPTPDQTLLQTPTMPTPGTVPTPYRSYHIPSSSPFHSHSTTLHTPGHEDESMELDPFDNRDTGEPEEEVKRRYEETNRLLAELEVVRRRRWGES